MALVSYIFNITGSETSFLLELLEIAHVNTFTQKHVPDAQDCVPRQSPSEDTQEPFSHIENRLYLLFFLKRLKLIKFKNKNSETPQIQTLLTPNSRQIQTGFD